MMKTNGIYRFVLRFLIACGIAVVLLVLYAILCAVRGCMEYDISGKDCSRFFHAMAEGDANEAILTAQKIKDDNYIHRSSINADWALGLAFELAGRYDSAWDSYWTYIKESNKTSGGLPWKEEVIVSLLSGRIAYKEHCFCEAFKEYCSYIKHSTANIEEKELAAGELSHNSIKTRIRLQITSEIDRRYMRLSPFYEFEDFRAFMDEEFEKLESPEVYEREMMIIRDIDELKDKIDAVIDELVATGSLPYISRTESLQEYRERWKRERSNYDFVFK